jgi:hypothetical protein
MGEREVRHPAAGFIPDAVNLGRLLPRPEVSGRDAIYELLKQFFAGGTC